MRFVDGFANTAKLLHAFDDPLDREGQLVVHWKPPLVDDDRMVAQPRDFLRGLDHFPHQRAVQRGHRDNRLIALQTRRYLIGTSH